ncbi:hypothetical protein DFP72DRAFT_860379 [Ephemerocybe angulata]|uniref:Uncharacterized protein n=1 Tax=Ephemerocybe angulata TaxID=980116 RepID=A0A8H6H9R7_9AGAR|nr:hypothetical protein DFP72DRAFT_860379 [Tulosesus angulatus]
MRLTFIPALTVLALGVASTFTTAYAYASHDNFDARSIIDPGSNTLDARYGSGIEVPFQPVLRDFLEEAVDAYRRHLSESESLEARADTWYTFKYGERQQRMECTGTEPVKDIKKRLWGLSDGKPETLSLGSLFIYLPSGIMFYLDENKSLNSQKEKVNAGNPIWFKKFGEKVLH